MPDLELHFTKLECNKKVYLFQYLNTKSETRI